LSVQATTRSSSVGDRRRKILDAAEACFVRNGFHRTTMNDVAAEAGMSAGNLYRYFASKEAIVTGLAERDREMMTADFAAMSSSNDFFTCFEAIGRKHLVDEPREKAVLAVEIWSEACRNPHVSTMCDSMDSEVRQNLAQMLERARATGDISPNIDIAVAVQLIFTMADGLFKRRALEADFDGEYEVAVTTAFFKALLTGGFEAPARATRSPARAPHSDQKP
jgi:TetR/AcrR family transcriptional repressor of uid operon